MKNRIKKIIDNDVFLSKIRKLLNGKEAYLAGGYIRDLALSKRSSEIVYGKNADKDGFLDFNDLTAADRKDILRDRDIVLFNVDTEKVSRIISKVL